jgi:hypothetical protein
MILLGFILFAASFTQGFTWHALALMVAGLACAVGGKALADKRRGTSNLGTFFVDGFSRARLVDQLTNPPSHTRKMQSD